MGALELISTADVRVVPLPEWDDLVARLGGMDTYTCLAYHRASAVLEPAGTRPLLLHHIQDHGEVALPVLVRPLPDGSGWDASSAYGYGGPVAASAADGRIFGAAIDTWAGRNGVVATFLRLHPLLGNAALVPPTADLVELGSTVVWDVRPGRRLFEEMHPHHRRAARKADRAGLAVTVVPRPRELDAFRGLYETTMRRQGAEASYFFPTSYWEALLDEAEALGLVLVEGRRAGQVVAGLLCLSHGPRLHYHLGASAQEARTIGASNRCFLAAAAWAQGEQMTHFHLGGGLGGDSASPLFTFKSRYDPAAPRPSFQVAKWVHDGDRYRQLAGSDSTRGFFPPWRRNG